MRGVLRLDGTDLGEASAAADGRPLSACCAAFKPVVMALLASAEAAAGPAGGAEAVPGAPSRGGLPVAFSALRAAGFADDVYADEAPPGEDGTEGLKLPARKKARPGPRPEGFKPQG